MFVRLIRHLALCLPILFSAPALAQTAPAADAILQAWLASPHADSTSQSFRHWDNDGQIPGTCAVCHSTPGAVSYMEGPQTVAGVIDHPVPTGTTVECAACHSPGAQALTEVLFPSGERVPAANSSAVCSVCHQGRASGARVDTATAALDADEVSTELGFINIHYAAAAATNLGGLVRGGYQYEGRDYAGPFAHVEGLNTCVACHGAHESTLTLDRCTTCHQGATDFRAIRTTPLDILGDGDTGAGIAHVIDRLHDRLLDAIMTYAAEVNGAPILYSDAAFPYFFNDTNANGTVDDGEAIFPNRYASWSPRLLRAAYNYQFVAKDHGAFSHNAHYAIQLMIDSLEDLATMVAIDTAGLVRP